MGKYKKGFKVDSNVVEDWHLLSINKKTIKQFRKSLTYIKYHQFKKDCLLDRIKKEMNNLQYVGYQNDKLTYMFLALKVSNNILK